MTMEEVLRSENLKRAYSRVKSNGGAPGVDGMTVEELGSYLVHPWEGLPEQLSEGSYHPSPVRLVEIPKPDGRGKRRLGIPTVLDRLIQQSILQVLQPVLDPMFSESSFGFRPGRSAHQALRLAQEHARAGHRIVVNLDLAVAAGLAAVLSPQRGQGSAGISGSMASSLLPGAAVAALEASSDSGQRADEARNRS
jgi:RNA-directed DNA polymerase